VKILHFFDTVTLERGGTTRAMLDMSRVLAARGHDVTIATFNPADIPAEWSGRPDTPKTVVLPAPNLPGAFYGPGAFRLPRGLLDGVDVVHLHALWQPFTTAAFGAARAAGLPTVLSCHGMLDDWSMRQRTLKKKLYLGLYAGGIVKDVSVYHATADAERDQAAAWVPADRIEVVPYITDLEPFKSLPGPEDARDAFGIAPPEWGDPLNVLFLSRLHYKKQPDVLIRAAGLLRERGTPVNLLLAGTGEPSYLDQLRRLAGSLDLGESCRFLGMVTGDRKLSLYQAADLFCLPTSQENFGLVYTESLACGTPVIATKGTDIWAELESGGGAIIAGQTPEAVADAIGPLARDRSPLGAMGERGREHVFRWLDEHAVAGRFEAMYERAGQR